MYPRLPVLFTSPELRYSQSASSWWHETRLSVSVVTILATFTCIVLTKYHKLQWNMKKAHVCPHWAPQETYCCWWGIHLFEHNILYICILYIYIYIQTRTILEFRWFERNWQLTSELQWSSEVLFLDVNMVWKKLTIDFGAVLFLDVNIVWKKHGAISRENSLSPAKISYFNINACWKICRSSISAKSSA